MDISKEFTPISNLITVIKNSIPPRKNKSHVDGRWSDGFIYITEGCCTYELDGYSFDVKASDILYLAKGAVYTMDTHGALYSFIFCDFEFCSDEVRRSAVYTPKNSDEAERTFEKLYHAYCAHDTATAFSYLYRIYSMITDTERGYVAGSARERIRAAKERIDIEYADSNLSVESLADDMGVSTVYFRRLFASAYAATPQSYITSVRIAEAKKLLSYQFITIEECAYRTGFSSKQYFSRVFKEHTGITPGEYRRSKK